MTVQHTQTTITPNLRTQEANTPSTTVTYEGDIMLSNPQWHLQWEKTGH